MSDSDQKIDLLLPIAGGCQCGELRYEISELPLTLYVCHCTECQRQSSAGFGMSMPVNRSGFRLLLGTPCEWVRSSASGRQVSCAFCSRCGTRIFHAPSRNPAIVNIKPGTLDDTSWLRPVGHLWKASAQPWVIVPDGVWSYDGQPSDFGPLFDAWRELTFDTK